MAKSRYMIAEKDGKQVILDKHSERTFDSLELACRELNVHMEYENWLSDEWDKEKAEHQKENEAWHQRYARATSASGIVPTTRTHVDIRQRRRRAAG